MCRIASFVPNKFNKGDILDLLIDMQGWRTGNGFGFGAVIKGEFYVKKSILTLDEILKKKGHYKDFFGDIWNHDSHVLFHHRKASSGVITNRNCHPFISDKLLGCHNGGIKNFELFKAILGKEIKLTSDVDSELGIKLIERVGFY
jgi:predicted glutamine amidotransferase